MNDIMQHVECRRCHSRDGWAGTNLCDSCWELDGRIKRNLKLSAQIIAEAEAETGNSNAALIQETVLIFIGHYNPSFAANLRAAMEQEKAALKGN